MPAVDYYAILEVTKSATAEEIKKSYRKLALKHHPDRGGDANKFATIAKAYEVLSDDHKKRLYDMGGVDAVERSGNSSRAAPRQRKNAPFVSALKLSLEDVYSGVTKKLKITRDVCCQSCRGQGGVTQTCTPCRGSGTRTVMQRVGPGMVQQSQQSCPDCRGQGTSLKQGGACKVCFGKKIEQSQKQFNVEVPPGTQEGQEITFIGEGNESPGTLAGDIVFKIELKPHPLFSREGHHLIYNQKLTLFQALCGVSFYIEHLDGHQVHVNVNQVVKPGDMMCIPGQGLLHSFGPGKGSDRGNLYVRFDVDFPTTEHMNMIKTKGGAQWIGFLGQCLPQGTYANTTKPTGPTVDQMGIVTATKSTFVTEQTEKARWTRENNVLKKHLEDQADKNKSEEEDDDDHEGGPQMAGCQQM